MGIVVKEKTVQSFIDIYDKWQRQAINAADMPEFPAPSSLACVNNGQLDEDFGKWKNGWERKGFYLSFPLPYLPLYKELKPLKWVSSLLVYHQKHQKS